MAARFSRRSVGLIDQIEKMTYHTLVTLSQQRAESEGRDIVTEDDVRATAREALNEASGHVQSIERDACTISR